MSLSQPFAQFKGDCIRIGVNVVQNYNRVTEIGIHIELVSNAEPSAAVSGDARPVISLDDKTVSVLTNGFGIIYLAKFFASPFQSSYKNPFVSIRERPRFFQAQWHRQLFAQLNRPWFDKLRNADS